MEEHGVEDSKNCLLSLGGEEEAVTLLLVELYCTVQVVDLYFTCQPSTASSKTWERAFMVCPVRSARLSSPASWCI